MNAIKYDIADKRLTKKEMTSVYENILTICKDNNIALREYTHEPVYTSSVAAGVLLHKESEGSKSLVMIDREGRVAVITICGDERFNFKQIKELLGDKKASMCDEEKMSEALGVSVGGVSPFGYKESIRIFISSRLCEQERVFINPGKNDVTIEFEKNQFTSIVKHSKAEIFDNNSK